MCHVQAIHRVYLSGLTEYCSHFLQGVECTIVRLSMGSSGGHMILFEWIWLLLDTSSREDCNVPTLGCAKVMSQSSQMEGVRGY
jgi:hypothetical protein